MSTVPRPPRHKGPTYSALREAILERRKNPEPPKPRKRGRPRRDRNAPPDTRPLPISGPAPTELKIEGLLARGMTMAEQLGEVELKTRVVAAHAELRRQLLRSREMRERLLAATLPADFGAEEGRVWLERQLGRLSLDALHQGDVAGAIGAATTLAILSGHRAAWAPAVPRVERAATLCHRCCGSAWPAQRSGPAAPGTSKPCGTGPE